MRWSWSASQAERINLDGIGGIHTLDDFLVGAALFLKLNYSIRESALPAGRFRGAVWNSS